MSSEYLSFQTHVSVKIQSRTPYSGMNGERFLKFHHTSCHLAS